VSQYLDPTDAIFAPLIARRVAVAGFRPDEETRLTALFAQAGATCQCFRAQGLPLAVRRCDAVLVVVDELRPFRAENFARPVIAAITQESLRRYAHWIKISAFDWFFYPGTPDEVLTRTTLALQHHSGPRKARTGRAFSILLADDDPSYHDLFKWMLRSEAMVFRAVADGRKAVEATRDWLPDLVVLDVNMPGMDGFEVLAALKKDEDTKDIPVVMVTGDNEDTGVLRGLRLGAADYVVKPFDVPAVIERIRNIRSQTSLKNFHYLEGAS
jgi:CheY-like chemotaxis protein